MIGNRFDMVKFGTVVREVLPTLIGPEKQLRRRHRGCPNFQAVSILIDDDLGHTHVPCRMSVFLRSPLKPDSRECPNLGLSYAF